MKYRIVMMLSSTKKHFISLVYSVDFGDKNPWIEVQNHLISALLGTGHICESSVVAILSQHPPGTWPIRAKTSRVNNTEHG